MYTSFYNLSAKPFQINTDPRFLWLGEKHKEALAVLRIGLINQNGFLLLTGDVGTGKTTLVNALLKSLDNNVLVASITDPNLDLMGFLNHIARSFKIPQRFDRKEDFLIDFKNFLENTCLNNAKQVLLIIDEAHKLSKELLEQVRLLSNIEMPERKLINIFLVGQNELNQTLISNNCRALLQRITQNYNIKPLSENETREYIKYRLKVAGTESHLFSLKAINEIYRFSGGCPRLINTICDRALLTGYVMGQKMITPNIILECSKEVLLPGETKMRSFSDLSQPLSPENLSSSVEEVLLTDEAELSPFSDLPQPLSPENLPSSVEEVQLTDEAELGSFSDLPQPLSPENPPSPVDEVLLPDETEYGNIGTVFQQNGNMDLPLKEPATVCEGLNTVGKIEAEGRWNSALRPKIKELIKGGLTAINFYEPNRRRLIYGVMATSLIVLATVFYSLLFSGSDHQAPMPRELNDRALTKALPSVASVGKQMVVTSPEKDITAKTNGGANPGKRSSLDQAKVAIKENKFSRAGELLEEVMAHQEGNQPEIKALYVQALIGQARLLPAKDTDQIEKLLRKAVKKDPQNAIAYYDLGKLYAKKKDYLKAIEVYSKAAELNPDSANTLFNLGFSYAAIKNYVNAEKMFLRVSELKPTYLDKAIFNLALVQYKQGKKEQCLKNLKKALEVNPANQRARKYLERFLA
ncbi:MAG: AAA family ATPase [Pseudomonadota bacterium]